MLSPDKSITTLPSLIVMAPLRHQLATNNSVAFLLRLVLSFLLALSHSCLILLAISLLNLEAKYFLLNVSFSWTWEHQEFQMHLRAVVWMQVHVMLACLVFSSVFLLAISGMPVTRFSKVVFDSSAPITVFLLF